MAAVSLGSFLGRRCCCAWRTHTHLRRPACRRADLSIRRRRRRPRRADAEPELDHCRPADRIVQLQPPAAASTSNSAAAAAAGNSAGGNSADNSTIVPSPKSSRGDLCRPVFVLHVPPVQLPVKRHTLSTAAAEATAVTIVRDESEEGGRRQLRLHGSLRRLGLRHNLRLHSPCGTCGMSTTYNGPDHLGLFSWTVAFKRWRDCG